MNITNLLSGPLTEALIGYGTNYYIIAGVVIYKGLYILHTGPYYLG